MWRSEHRGLIDYITSNTKSNSDITTINTTLNWKVPCRNVTFTNGQTLPDICEDITFEPGIYTYQLYTQNMCRGVLFMSSVNNNYGKGLYLSYYDTNTLSIVNNVNRVFTVVPV